MKTEIKDRPMLFSASMVRAILDGSKTQTRRTNGLEWTNMSMPDMWDRVEIAFYGNDLGAWFHFDDQGINRDTFVKWPYGKVGDRLWVRETWQVLVVDHHNLHIGFAATDCTKGIDREMLTGEQDQQAARFEKKSGFVPSIHMPRWASRINLEIAAVRIERLNDISDEDAKSEGLRYHNFYKEWGGVELHPSSIIEHPHWRWYETPEIAFENLWESINGAGSWKQNPWVWVIEFKRV